MSTVEFGHPVYLNLLKSIPSSFPQFVQSIGYYIEFIIQLGWHTDAFEQLGKSSEASYKRFVVGGFESSDGPQDWFDSWTLFYWGMWISWSPFVGRCEPQLVKLDSEADILFFKQNTFFQECS